AAVSWRTEPLRPQIHNSAPSARYFAAISLPRPVPPPVMRMRLPLSRPSLNMGAPEVRAHSKRREYREPDCDAEERQRNPRNGGEALLSGKQVDEESGGSGSGRLPQEHRRRVERDRDRRLRRRDGDESRLLRA